MWGVLCFADGPTIKEGANNAVASGPALVFIENFSGQMYLRVFYSGYLTHEADHINVGVILNGTFRGYFPYDSTRVDGAWIPLYNLSRGDLQLFFANVSGHYDSDFRRNYRFTLQ